jgi:hypothetical protein
MKEMGRAPENESGVTVQIELRAPARARRAVGVDHRGQEAQPPSLPDRIPRIARLMALAIKFQDMIDRGEIRDYAEVARLGYVTRARVTQIMNLLNLAPDIQEALLHLPGDKSRGSVCERQIRDVARRLLWVDQLGIAATIMP